MDSSAADDLADDFESVSFNSTTTATTAVDAAKRSTSSGSESATTRTASSASSAPPPPPRPASSAVLSFADLRFVHRLGSGDIGSVYLVDLIKPDKFPPGEKSPPPSLLAAKVMDRKELASRNKESRAKIEREILEMLDHPFLPTLFAAIETPRWSCLLTEFCPGGDLHVLRQRRPDKRFDESAVR